MKSLGDSNTDRLLPIESSLIDCLYRYVEGKAYNIPFVAFKNACKCKYKCNKNLFKIVDCIGFKIYIKI